MGVWQEWANSPVDEYGEGINGDDMECYEPYGPYECEPCEPTEEEKEEALSRLVEIYRPSECEDFLLKNLLVDIQTKAEECNFRVKYIGGLLKFTSMGLDGRVMLELEQPEYLGCIVIYTHRDILLTMSYKGRIVSLEWVEDFLDANSNSELNAERRIQETIPEFEEGSMSSTYHACSLNESLSADIDANSIPETSSKTDSSRKDGEDDAIDSIEGMIPLSDYCRIFDCNSATVVARIGTGQLRGKVINGTWFVDSESRYEGTSFAYNPDNGVTSAGIKPDQVSSTSAPHRQILIASVIYGVLFAFITDEFSINIWGALFFSTGVATPLLGVTYGFSYIIHGLFWLATRKGNPAHKATMWVIWWLITLLVTFGLVLELRGGQ